VYFAFGPGGTDWTPLAGDWNGPSSTSPVASAAVSEATLDAVASRKPSDRLSDEPDRRDEDDAHLTLIDETLATW
jgi:hypothetical protein